jgi:hypothetical protein
MNPASRNNVFAGLFLVFSLALGVWVTFTLSDRGTPGANSPVVIRFPIETGAYGLKQGSAVTLGGQRVGEVISTGFHTEPVENTKDLRRFIDVLAKVRGDLGIDQTSAANLDRPLLGSSSTINISMVGTGHAAPTWKPSELDSAAPVIVGTLSPPAVLQQAGFGPEQSKAVEKMVEDLRHTAATIRVAIDENAPKVSKMVDSTATVMNNVETRIPEWTSRIDRATLAAEKAAADLPSITQKFEKQVADIGSIISRNSDKIDSIISKTERTTALAESALDKVDRESIAALNRTLRDSQEAVEKLKRPLAQFRDLMNEDLPQIKTIVANGRLASEQLKLTATEVRAQPWRLLYRPDTRELQVQLLFDAARSYAQSVSDLKAASEALAGAESLFKDSANPENMAHVQAVAKDLEAALVRSREAEDIFMKRLNER